ncbi:MAG: ATP-dependent Clp protease adapter ClpS [Burkholderiaceae bacterium]|nr:ATP-dependent Clp protease adapter ClpS [Microbacteriaceae bacterium]
MPTTLAPRTTLAPDLDVDVDLNAAASAAIDSPWVTLVWNDPVNLMSYVSWVFRSYFGFSRAEADRRMLQVHHDGKTVVATGSREEMERHVEAMHDFGLWATLTKADA